MSLESRINFPDAQPSENDLGDTPPQDDKNITKFLSLRHTHTREQFSVLVAESAIENPRIYKYLVSYPNKLSFLEWRELYVHLGIRAKEDYQNLVNSSNSVNRRIGFLMQFAYNQCH